MMSGHYICPRCGNTGYPQKETRRGRTYLYCYHYRIENGKRKAWRCYLGAEKYVNVERFQQLELSGLSDKNRYKKYILNILDKLEPEDLKWLQEEIKNRLIVLEG